MNFGTTKTVLASRASSRCPRPSACCLTVFLLLATPAGLFAVDPAAEPAVEFFETAIRPLLVERCQSCHGPDKQWASLRLDSRDLVLQGGDSGPAIVPGHPEQSELINRVSETDDDLRMPPAKGGKPLTAQQIANLRQWIADGAAWPAADAKSTDRRRAAARDHWAFQPVRQPAVPDVTPADQDRSPIDSFILARLAEAELAPSPPADRRTLIRRATYDLTGLPPTPEETAHYLADEAPDADARLIDRLLDSPRYGEQWGRHWLDVARYSDTKGYVYAREERFFVHAPVYRDWVVNAFNGDMPYDRFLLLQVAADQVAPTGSRDLAALGLLTTGRRFIGVMPDIMDDRIDVVTRGLMGLTVSCARCHDHKYDPIPTADYYSLYGVFQNCVQQLAPVARAEGAPEPSADFVKELQARQQKLQEVSAARRATAGERIRHRLTEYLLAQRELEKYPEQGFDQVLSADDLIPAVVRRWESYLARAAVTEDPVWTAWLAFAQLPDDGFAAAAVDVARELTQSAAGNRRVALAFATPPASAQEVAERYAQLATEIEAQRKTQCEAATANGQPLPPALPDADDEALRQMLLGPNSPCVLADEPIANLEVYFDSATVNELWGLQNEVDRWLLASPDAAPHALVLTDRPWPIDPQIFRRGNPANKGETVPRQFLSVLAGDDRRPFEQGSGRLELAEAIVSPDNPLTARVWVNRVWLHHFGAGLVRTPSDFGTRAEPPSHPELLDWLTAEFIAHGWSTKWLHRTIMLSATYQQRSAGPETPSLAARVAKRDPENRLLWRMNARRLSFEQLRDTLVAASGELDLQAGGKGVELFPAAAPFRRSIYGIVDRQFVPAVLRNFDFANPDLHSPQRSETTVPQQALFALNDPFVAGRARALAARIAAAGGQPPDYVTRLYQAAVQRDPTADELEGAVTFLSAADEESPTEDISPTAADWVYGYGELDEASGRVKSFEPLPHFDGAAWQGGPQWPDAKLGWVQLTPRGGHAGNDRAHAAIRRWTARAAGNIAVESKAIHEVAAGDGIRCWIASSRHGLLGSATVHNTRQPLHATAVDVQAGDTIDFVVDLRDNLNSDQFIWAPTIHASATAGVTASWHAERDFSGPPRQLLTPSEQLAQLLLMSNEVMFVD